MSAGAGNGSAAADRRGQPNGARLVLSLFVTDETPSSTRARAQLARWFEGRGEDVELEVVNVLERPELAEAERVLATPALVRHRPLPRRKIVGDLSDWEAVAQTLELQESSA